MKKFTQSIFYKIANSPSGLYVLLYTEIWELFGRFGITALLVLYVTKTFNLPDAQAFALYSGFIALTFVTPLLGGYIADKFLGYKQSVIAGAIIMTIGNGLIVIPDKTLVYLGLAIVATGSGFFTAALTALLGRIYDHHEKGRDAGFTLYHIAKNIGALLAPLLCGLVGQAYGLNYAFLLSALGMFSGLIVFIFGQKRFHAHYLTPIIHKSKTAKYRNHILIYAATIAIIPFVYLVLSYNLDGYLLIAATVIASIVVIKIVLKQNKTERRNIAAIIIMLVFFTVFYAYLSQGGTTLNLFIDRIVNRDVFGMVIPTSFFYSLNPVFMILVGPILAIFSTRLANRHREPSVVTKFALAMFILSLGFIVFILASNTAIATGHTHASYVVLAYLLFPIAELLIIPISLSLTTRLAPRNLSGVMVGIWMLANAGATYFTSIISRNGQINFSVTRLQDLQHAAIIYKDLFIQTSIVLVITGIILLLLKPLILKLMNAKV